MIVTCPNCFASYNYGQKEENSLGHEFKCGECSQEWSQYSVPKLEGIDNRVVKTEPKVKELAYEEYLISLQSENKVFSAEQDDPALRKVSARLQQSSERLKETKQALKDKENQINAQNPSPNIYSVLGFSFISLIAVSFGALYLFSREIERLVPNSTYLITPYTKWVDTLIQAVDEFTIRFVSYFF